MLADLPIAYWRLDDLDTIARDELGASDGSIEGGCQHGVGGALADDADRAIRFDGATCRITFPDRFNFPGNSRFSVEVWVSLAQTGGYQHFFTNQVRNGSDPIDGYALLAGPGGVYFERVRDLSNRASQQLPIGANAFAHVVAVYDGSDVRLYVNSSPVGDPTPDARSMRSFATTPLAGASPAGNAFTNGVLDELAIYDEVLSVDRIQLHHAIGRTGPR